VSASARGGSRKKVFEKQNWCWENLLKTLFFILLWSKEVLLRKTIFI